MCHNAWQRPMHVGHMAHLKAINMVLFVEGGATRRKMKEKKKERERKERKRGKEKREKKKGKKERTSRFSSDRRCFDGRN